MSRLPVGGAARWRSDTPRRGWPLGCSHVRGCATVGSDFRQTFVDLLCLNPVLCGRSGINASTTTGCEGSIPQGNPSRQPLRHTAPMPSRRLLPRSHHPRKRPPHPPLGAVVIARTKRCRRCPMEREKSGFSGLWGDIYTNLYAPIRGVKIR